VSFLSGRIFTFFGPENMISTHTKDFCEKLVKFNLQKQNFPKFSQVFVGKAKKFVEKIIIGCYLRNLKKETLKFPLTL